MLSERDDIVALDSAILQHPKVWEASGHLAGFTDPLVDCRSCKQRFRADHVDPRRDLPGQGQPAQDRGPPPRLHRGPAVQPDVRDDGRPGQGDRLGPPTCAPRRPRASSSTSRTSCSSPARSRRSASRRSASRSATRSRRATSSSARASSSRLEMEFFVPPPEGARLVRVLEGRAPRLVRGAGHPARPPASARARAGRAQPLLVGHRRRRVPVSRSAGPSSRASPTAATST